MFSGLSIVAVSQILWIVWLYYFGGFNFPVLFSAVALAGLGIGFGRMFPNEPSLVALFGALPYVLVHGYQVLRTTLYVLDPSYNGHFWYSEFFIVPGLLYLSPVVLCILGAFAAARVSFTLIITLCLSPIFLVIGISSVVMEEPVKRTDMFTLKLTDSENAQLSIEVKCEYTERKDYWNFRDLSTGECSDSTVVIIEKKPELDLPVDGFWIHDGHEEHVSIWPVNRPDGSSHLDCFKPHCYDDIARWKMWFSFAKIANAKTVTFRWGEIRVDLGEKEFEQMREFRKKVEQLVDE